MDLDKFHQPTPVITAHDNQAVQSKAFNSGDVFSKESKVNGVLFFLLGAVAERVKLSSYMIFAFLNTGLVYVFPAHWMWDENGWLYKKGALDFAGTSVVHMAGGISALIAAIILGPRINRFGASKEKYYMASPTNLVLGGMLLWWGWIGFNCGSTFTITADGQLHKCFNQIFH